MHNPWMKFVHCSSLPCSVRCPWGVHNCLFLIAGVDFSQRILQHSLLSASGFQARSFAPPARSGRRVGEVSPARAMCFSGWRRRCRLLLIPQGSCVCGGMGGMSGRASVGPGGFSFDKVMSDLSYQAARSVYRRGPPIS